MKCGMARIHLTSQSARERGSSILPSTMTGYGFMAPSSAPAGACAIREGTEPLRKQLVEREATDLRGHAPAPWAGHGGARQRRSDPRDEEGRPRRQAQCGEERG